jgi:hypothetical protein
MKMRTLRILVEYTYGQLYYSQVLGKEDPE